MINYEDLSKILDTAHRAASATVATVAVLCDRLGLDSTEVVRELREADDLARAVGEAVRTDPSLAVPLTAHLRARECHDLADALDGVAVRAALTPTTTTEDR